MLTNFFRQPHQVLEFGGTTSCLAQLLFINLALLPINGDPLRACTYASTTLSTVLFYCAVLDFAAIQREEDAQAAPEIEIEFDIEAQTYTPVSPSL